MSDTLIQRSETDLLAAVRSTDQASEGTTSARDHAAASSTKVGEEIHDITETLSTRYDGLTTALLGQVTTFEQTVRSAGWSGVAREAALAAAGNLRAQINATVSDMRGSLDGFTGSMVQEATVLRDGVRTDLGNAMTQLSTSLQGLGLTMSTFNERMNEIEQTGSNTF